ncbi:MAG: phosphate signaling complex protein PhoU [Pseudomonadota bacterium]
MDYSDTHEHTMHRFDVELDRVRSQLLEMGGLVEEQMVNAVQALVSGDTALGESVISRDYLVNRHDVEIDESCTAILARRQPTAIDLRLVLTVIKITADLERIGDEAKRVARMAVRLASADHSRSLFLELEHLGTQVRGMLRGALDAFARMDPEAAVEVAKQDGRVDGEYENAMRQSITFMMEDPRSIPLVLDIIWAARALERTGDRCCNISEYVVYFVKGKDVRHTSLDQMEMAAKESK